MSIHSLNTEEASYYMKSKGYTFSPATLKMWRSQGKGPRYKVVGDKKVYYDINDLNEFIKGKNSDRI